MQYWVTIRELGDRKPFKQAGTSQIPLGVGLGTNFALRSLTNNSSGQIYIRSIGEITLPKRAVSGVEWVQPADR